MGIFKYNLCILLSMLTIEEIREALADRNLSHVARKCGISGNTLYSIVKNPERDKFVRYETIKKLSDYLEGKI